MGPPRGARRTGDTAGPQVWHSGMSWGRQGKEKGEEEEERKERKEKEEEKEGSCWPVGAWGLLGAS